MNRSIKRILSIALALCFALSLAGTAFAEEQPPVVAGDVVAEPQPEAPAPAETGDGGAAPANPDEQPGIVIEEPSGGDMAVVPPGEVEVIEQDAVVDENGNVASPAVPMDKLLELAAQDGAAAAEMLNAIADDAQFEEMLKAVLKVYYSADLQNQLAAFLSTINEKAMPIIAGFDAAALQRASTGLPFVPGEVLVVFNPPQANAMGEVIMRHEAELVRTVETTTDDVVAVVNIPVDQTVEQAVAEMSSDPSVAYVQPNFLYEKAETVDEIAPAAALNDEYASNLWHLNKINDSAARDIIDTLGSKNKIRVAVIDDRTDITHPDLAPNINASLCADVYTGVVQPYPTSGYEEHGTHVAGIIGAVANNSIGVAGTGSGSKNQVLEMIAVNVYSPTAYASTVSLMAGVNYAVNQGARVLNISAGYKTSGSSYDGLLKECIDTAVGKGAVVVCASGNYATDAQVYPGDIESTINVIATTNYTNTSENSKAGYSDFGSKKTISAPGSSIYSTIPGGYKSKSGTSMAAPVVSGVAAMMLYANSSLAPAQVKSILTQTATDLYTPGFDTQTAWGNVNAQAALERVTGIVSKLAAPENLVATGNGENSITLTWDKVSGADGYDVSRAASFDGEYSLISSIPASGTASYVDSGLNKSTVYYYKVIAYKGSGSAKQSGFIAGPLAQTAAYPPPAGLKAVVKSDSSIQLSWTKEDGMNGYTVYRASSADGSYAKAGTVNSAATTSYTDTGLSTGQTYYYKISAFKTSGSTNTESLLSSAVSAKTEGGVTPVEGLTADSTGYDSIELNWTAAGTDAAGYYVYRAEKSATATYTRVGEITSADENMFADAGLSTGRTYYYKVVSYSQPTTDVDLSGATAEDVIPVNAAVTGLKAQSVGYNTLKLSWKKSAGCHGYDIYRSESSSSGFKKVSTVSGANTVTYKEGGLTTGKTYYYRVIPFRNMSIGKIEGGMSQTSGVPLVAAPKNFTAKGASANSIQLTWEKPTGASGYMLVRATEKEGPYKNIKTITSASTLSYLNSGLAKGQKYYYKIKPYRTVDGKRVMGVTSDPVAGQTKDGITTPSNLTAKTSNYNQLTLNWDKVSGANGYIVYRATSSSGTYARLKSVDSNKYVDDNLTESSTFYYKVRAFVTSGSSTTYSGYSRAVSGQTKSKPLFGIGLTNKSYDSVATLVFTMTNKGTKNMTVASDSSRLIDATDPSYSRDLQLLNPVDKTTPIESFTATPGVQNTYYLKPTTPSRYNMYSVIRFRFQYDGLWYICDANTTAPKWYIDTENN